MGSTGKLIISYWLLALIVVSALGVRIFRLGDSPPSVNWDEASLGYNAFSLLHTGKDEYSKPLPVSLRSFDDYKPAVYSYLIVPILTRMPLSDISNRLPSAIMGSLLTISIFIISYLLTKSRVLGLGSALLITFEPWALHFSRVSFEANVANSLIFLALALFLYAVHTKKFLIQSLVLFILSTYTYHSERAIAIPMFIALTFIYRRQIVPQLKHRLVPLLIIFTLLLVPLGLSFITQPITSRLTSTSLLKLWPFIPQNYSMLIFNPFYTLLWHLCGQFLAYFSPYNLFVAGSIEPGQYIPTLGLLNTIEFPFWIAGVFILLRQSDKRRFLLPIMFLATLPALITWNWFSVVRTLTLYPIFSILVCLGFGSVFNYIQVRFFKIMLILCFGIIWGISVEYLLNTEIVYAPAITYGEYQPGFEKGIPLLMAEAKDYDHVIIDSPHIAPYIFLLFYSQYDPHLYQQQVPHRIKNSGTESIPFGKFEFRQIDWVKDKFLSHTLFMGPTVRLPDYEFDHSNYARLLHDIYDIRGYISLRIVATN